MYAAEEALKLWASVSVVGGQRAQTLAAFTARLMKVLRLRRRQAREIAYAGIRLERALRTGYTLPEEGSSERLTSVQIDELRDDFARLVHDYAPDALKKPDPKTIPDHPASEVVVEPWKNARRGGEARVERVSKLFEDFKANQRREEAEAQARLDALTAMYDRQAKEREEAARRELQKREQERLERKQREAHEEAAKIIAGEAAKSAQDAARNTTWSHARRDKRVYGYIRVHNPVNGSKPCAFCAVLLSQGPRVYSSREAAGGDGRPEQRYHPNCRCQGVAIYSLEEYETDPRFAPNRFYHDLYMREYQKKYQGKPTDRRIEWRNHIDLLNGTISRPRKRMSKEAYSRSMRSRRSNKR